MGELEQDLMKKRRLEVYTRRTKAGSMQAPQGQHGKPDWLQQAEGYKGKQRAKPQRAQFSALEQAASKAAELIAAVGQESQPLGGISIFGRQEESRPKEKKKKS